MKVSEIQVSDIVSYARIEEGEYTTEAIENLISIAKLFISNYTGIPVTATETAIKCLEITPTL
jgi:hypothetical protein